MIGCDGCDKWYHWNCVGIDKSVSSVFMFSSYRLKVTTLLFRTNKPGKEDDWFCKKCRKQKKEAGEWKPSQDQQHKVEVKI